MTAIGSSSKKPHSASAAAHYIGRFAPTPSGALHLGSVSAAVASWLDARHTGGRWHLRIDDIDPPRVVPGAADTILATLDRLALHWDGPVVYQSQRTEHYRAATEHLRDTGQAFGCACSRADIRLAGEPGPEGPIYPGTCREGIAPGRSARATRLRVSATPMAFTDRRLGAQQQNLAALCGDFVIQRADGPYAYQLACVVDDAALGVTDVVRGADLLGSTGRQIRVYQALHKPQPRYLHTPALTDAQGNKLSKSRGAEPVSTWAGVEVLGAALTSLGQALPGERPANCAELLTWATDRWDTGAIPSVTSLQCPDRPPWS